MAGKKVAYNRSNRANPLVRLGTQLCRDEIAGRLKRIYGLKIYREDFKCARKESHLREDGGLHVPLDPSKASLARIDHTCLFGHESRPVPPRQRGTPSSKADDEADKERQIVGMLLFFLHRYSEPPMLVAKIRLSAWLRRAQAENRPTARLVVHTSNSSTLAQRSGLHASSTLASQRSCCKLTGTSPPARPRSSSSSRSPSRSGSRPCSPSSASPAVPSSQPHCKSP